MGLDIQEFIGGWGWGLVPEKVGRGFRSRFDTHGGRGKKGDRKNLGLQFQERFGQADGDSSQSHLLGSSISVNGPALVPHMLIG